MLKILGLFVKTLTADEKYYLVNRGNLTQHIQMTLFKKQKTFLYFLLSLNIKLNFEHFQKKVTVIADVVLELQTPKDLVR